MPVDRLSWIHGKLDLPPSVWPSRPGYPRPMPDAPAPTYDSHGNIVPPWSVTATYDPVRDEINVRSYRGESSYLKAVDRVWSCDGDDVEAAVEHLAREVRVLGSPRLF